MMVRIREFPREHIDERALQAAVDEFRMAHAGNGGNLHSALRRSIGAYEGTKAVAIKSKEDFHDDPVEQLAFELAFELEESELSRGDLVTVNREKLKAIAKRMLSRVDVLVTPSSHLADAHKEKKGAADV